MLLFKKKFLPAIRSGQKTQTIRLWKHRRMRAGQRSYIPGAGHVRLTAVDEVRLDELTDADARPDGFATADAVALYAARYAGEPFVTVHPAGRMPSTAEVRGSNRAHIGVAVDRASGTLIATCAIDNLVKGSGGQAIQCANIALGLPETAGLTAPAPVV